MSVTTTSKLELVTLRPVGVGIGVGLGNGGDEGDDDDEAVEPDTLTHTLALAPDPSLVLSERPTIERRRSARERYRIFGTWDGWGQRNDGRDDTGHCQASSCN